MVDIGATGRTARAADRNAGAGIASLKSPVDVRPADAVALAEYEAFCASALYAPPQNPVWVRAWIGATQADAFVATVGRDGRAAIALVLEVVREGPFRIARFVGGSHANGNFAAMAKGSHEPLARDEYRALTEAIHIARPDVDLVVLERQNPAAASIPNPLTNMATMPSPNVSLAVDLSGGFDAMLTRRNGKRKRKKYRLQLRKFEDAGGHRLFEAGTPAEVERLISEFFVMKAARFQERGITDVFAPQEVQAFFRDLFMSALEQPRPPFFLTGLEVAGRLQGVNGFSVMPDGVVCEFCAMRDEDLGISPGFFLDYVAMEQACADAMGIFDFSVGDEEYKRSWCDLETWQFDTLLPLTGKGRLLSAWKIARAKAVHRIKSNATLWSAVKRLRTRVAGAKPAGDD